MKSKDETLNLAPEQLQNKLVELQEELANLLLQITNPLRIRTVRRNIARVNTLVSEFKKEIRTLKGQAKE